MVHSPKSSLRAWSLVVSMFSRSALVALAGIGLIAVLARYGYEAVADIAVNLALVCVPLAMLVFVVISLRKLLSERERG